MNVSFNCGLVGTTGAMNSVWVSKVVVVVGGGVM